MKPLNLAILALTTLLTFSCAQDGASTRVQGQDPRGEVQQASDGTLSGRGESEEERSQNEDGTNNSQGATEDQNPVAPVDGVVDDRPATDRTAADFRFNIRQMNLDLSAQGGTFTAKMTTEVTTQEVTLQIALDSSLKGSQIVRDGSDFVAVLFQCRTATCEESIIAIEAYDRQNSNGTLSGAIAEVGLLMDSTDTTYLRLMAHVFNNALSMQNTSPTDLFTLIPSLDSQLQNAL